MEVRLFDFQTVSRRDDQVDEDAHIDAQMFIIQMFGINEKGETFSIEVHDFKPYFYCLVPSHFTIADKNTFVNHIKQKVGNYYAESILECALIKRKKIDGFDAQSDHKFICFKFKGMSSFYKARNLWYNEIKKDNETKQVLKACGYNYMGSFIKLYEANIPPLLRYFHIKEISPSGWIKLPKTLPGNHTTTCTHEFIVSTKDIVALPEKETIVPYKICSFDIEASSSHGDFPVPIKDYKKLAENILEEFRTITDDHEGVLRRCIHAAFGYDSMHNIDLVYTKEPISKEEIDDILSTWIHEKIQGDIIEEVQDINESSDEEEEEEETGMTVIELLKKDIKCVNELRKALNSAFPPIEGDKVTFIGSTFVHYGTPRPYLNHCIVLGGCSPVENIELECYKTEREVLVAWTNLIQREDPDIIIGYNIFGFDEQFMFKRSVETNCTYDFLSLTRNKKVLSGKQEHGVWGIEQKSVFLASGEYNLNYFKMDGRIHLDLYTVFRRDYNFDSYKLDSVSAYFIGDKVSKLETEGSSTKIYTKNLQGLEKTNYVVFEEVSHSSDFYRNGQKFKVVDVASDHFVVASIVRPDMKKQVKWCLAKDDVDHHDIFRLTNGTDDDRAVIATYCIQDCNLVQHLLQKTDMLTGFIEMSTICSVPIEFLIMRGQGIKLTSYISKQCRKRNTLMPVLQTKEFDDGYEGAIVLDPKCNIYTEDPVAVVDYKSLYPSSMISENICSSSKVWTKEYNLDDTLVRETGVKRNGEYIYDNLPEYTYVDITYDTYKYIRKTPKAKAVKTKSGYKTCRFAQFPEGKAIMPSVLEELLHARSSTRKLIAKEKDEFMKNILDKRQNAYKITANSLYGQCGARTSTFYDKDVAASCTSTGRKLLIYAKTMIEEVYDHRECETSEGMVNATAEYIYGDTDSVFFKFTLLKNGVQLKGKDALGLTIELAKEAGELATMFLKEPHELEYEKTFFPFVLLSKKRYVGMLYENDTVKCSRKSMGIVLKRRDNAPIVKDVYGGLIDILMKDGDIVKAIDFIKEKLRELSQGKISLDKLIITKSLRSGYKKPLQMAHKVLADRMGHRDPGNKPKPGDRIRFVFVKTPPKKGQLQGEKIESPEFIRANSLTPDYNHYITNQLMKPIQQVIELVLDTIPNYRKEYMESELAKLKDLPQDKYEKKRETIRYKEVNRILFDEFKI
jgi:DNA polymerase elongation subunit (family B)